MMAYSCRENSPFDHQVQLFAYDEASDVVLYLHMCTSISTPYGV